MNNALNNTIETFIKDVKDISESECDDVEFLREMLYKSIVLIEEIRISNLYYNGINNV